MPKYVRNASLPPPFFPLSFFSFLLPLPLLLLPHTRPLPLPPPLSHLFIFFDIALQSSPKKDNNARRRQRRSTLTVLLFLPCSDGREPLSSAIKQHQTKKEKTEGRDRSLSFVCKLDLIIIYPPYIHNLPSLLQRVPQLTKRSSPLANVGILQADIFFPIPTSSFRILLRYHLARMTNDIVALTARISFSVCVTSSVVSPPTATYLPLHAFPTVSPSDWKRDQTFFSKRRLPPVSIVGSSFR